ncbi:MAG TPA: bifunctional [glutamate--ammonia ligase]-adenylyl-L-tyrosine phosphorylase/[glutamate--ammonia-ligase] adenylyltransferase, partial [Kangiella sp.]
SKHGKPRQDAGELVTDFLVLGYGKLGGDELGYGSDLDLVFLYQGEPDAMTQISGEQGKPLELHQFYTRLAQRLVHYLGTRTQQGIMYEVDTRLRPSGRSGMLVSHIDAFDKYQMNEAWTWEHQALVRARPVAGDTSLRDQYLQLRNKVLSCDKREQLGQDVVTMRKKMRDNLDKTDTRLWDIKQGNGGLVDIEFLVQYWALKYSKSLLEQCSVDELPFNNVDWLQLLAGENLLEKSTRDCMMENYRLLRDIANSRALQNQPALLAKEELTEQRQAIVEVWQSTFQHSDVE